MLCLKSSGVIFPMVIISIGKLFRVDETDSGNRLPKTKREIEIERERKKE